MSWSEFLPAQNLMTLGLGLLFAIAALGWFLRKRSNRSAYSHAFKGDEDSALRRRAETTRADQAPAAGGGAERASMQGRPAEPVSSERGRHPER